MKEGKRRSLGRGLSALLGDDSEDYASLDRLRHTKEVPIEQLRPNPYQPRRYFDEGKAKEMADSVREKGILEPLLVRRVPDELNVYEIVAGERRWRAAQKAQLHEVPVVIRELNDSETLEISLVENLQREDLTPLDEALAFSHLIEDFSHTQEQIGRIVGKSRSHVANMLRLLSLPDEIRDMLADGRLSAGHARALVNADEPARLAHLIVDNALTVRQAEAMAKRIRTKRKGRTKKAEQDSDTRALEGDISAALGLKVRIGFKGENKGGDVKISYKTLEQLDEICRRLCYAGES